MCCEEDSPTKHPELIHPSMRTLCEEYKDIFKEVIGLPPKRTHDHQIPLVPGAEPVNLRPYRYPWEQKNIIERMIEEMLSIGHHKEQQEPLCITNSISKKG